MKSECNRRSGPPIKPQRGQANTAQGRRGAPEPTNKRNSTVGGPRGSGPPARKTSDARGGRSGARGNHTNSKNSLGTVTLFIFFFAHFYLALKRISRTVMHNPPAGCGSIRHPQRKQVYLTFINFSNSLLFAVFL